MTGSSGLAYDRYAPNEWLMRIGDAGAPPILVLPPLFEEMNRTRALIASVMRDLAGRGYACWLPDMPGTGESERALEDCTWNDWRDAARAAGTLLGCPATVSLRGGCLLDDAIEARCHWRFAPVEGASLARDLARSGLMTAGGSAGYTLSEDLAAGLRDAKLQPVAPLRVARLASDLAEADAKLDGPALWRRSEPANSSELAAAIASDVDGWMKRCGGC